jgi:excisionase family DNA binding protein
MNRDWYSVNEVAAILNESYKKIYNLVTSGELGHYRVGRSYRIRKADLAAYFAQQAKQLHPNLSQTVDMPETVVLDKVVTATMHAHQSADAPAYATAPPLPAPKMETPAQSSQHLPASASPVNTLPVSVAVRRNNVTMASVGEAPNSSRALRQREAAYIEHFQTLFHNGLAVAHPVTDEIIKFANWSVVEQVEDELLQLGQYLHVAILRPEQQLRYPNNVRVLYWVEPNSLGGILRKYPKEGFVIECAVLSRLERLVTVGHDDEHLGVSAIEQLLQERRALVQRWSARYAAPVAYLLGLASTTGWDQESIAYVNSFTDNSRLFLYLIDLIDLNVYTSDLAQKSAQYRELFELPLGENKRKQIEQQIEGILLTTGASRLADLQAQISCSQGLLREACSQLVQSNPTYTLLQTGNDWVIRTS